jgi:PAS domain-containing protein
MPNMPANIDRDFFPAVINAFPAPIFIVDDDVRISAINDVAASLLDDPATAIEMRGGEAWQATCFSGQDDLQRKLTTRVHICPRR